MVQIAKILSI